MCCVVFQVTKVGVGKASKGESEGDNLNEMLNNITKDIDFEKVDQENEGESGSNEGESGSNEGESRSNEGESGSNEDNMNEENNGKADENTETEETKKEK